MVDIGLISKRKRLYGDNFMDISRLWSDSLGVEVDTTMVCSLMADMKQCRIDNLNYMLAETSVEDSDHCTLLLSLRDNIDDRDNYLWIADNKIEYESIR